MSATQERYKELLGQANSLSNREPRTLVSVRLPEGPNASLATLYAELEPSAPNTVAVQLEAELMGTRQLVGTAGIPPGYAGVAVIATGIVADCWHASAYGILRQNQLTVKLGTRPCCSGFGVSVPAPLQTLVPRLKALVPAAVQPLVRHEGAYNLLWGAAGAVPIAETERILRIVAVADDPGDGTLSGFAYTIIHWAAGTVFEARPRGNSEGPRTLTFANTTYYQVEVVS